MASQEAQHEQPEQQRQHGGLDESSMRSMQYAQHDGLDDPEGSLRSILVGFARSAAIRYSILLPKVKAANFFQPEDHVAKDRIHPSLSGIRLVGITHSASIFVSGTLLFLVQESVLKRIEPSSHGDFGRASPLASAAAGGAGGIAYGIGATWTHAWLGTGSLSLKKWAFVLRALPFTLPRDAGGFALYFGIYSFVHRGLSSRAIPSLQHPTAETLEKSNSALLNAGTPTKLVSALTTIALSGACSGFGAYIWRTPWDTLYKRAMGWRDPDAPLWSFKRFLRSPRGLKAIGVGALTWSAYEVVDAGLRGLVPV